MSRRDTLRFTEKAAAKLRAAIEDAGGIEVFAIGELDEERLVSDIEVHCRGTDDAVPALLKRPRHGQVVIHNHPSGVLKASEADMLLANRYGDEGIGVVIVDNAVSRALWVVEPAASPPVPVDRAQLERFFLEDLPRAMGGLHEPRRQQLEMAIAVADALDGGGRLMVEAGTGTGKSLAYLVPAVMWAVANDSKVAVSTFTRNLQAQLITSDLLVMRRAGMDFTSALLKGRGNYLCRRKLDLALREPELFAEELERLRQWVNTTEEGSLQDLGEELEPELWERIQSDADTTLRARCKHYNECFYYQARRRAAASHLIVVNHALLLADLHIKAQTDGDGILPRFERVVLDEAHHLEDVATSVASQSVTRLGIVRAVNPLLPRRRGPGALAQLRERHADQDPTLPDTTVNVEHRASRLRDESGLFLDQIAESVCGEAPHRRLTEAVQQEADWESVVLPALGALSSSMREVHGRLGALRDRVDGLKIPPEQMQPVLDVRRTERRIGESMSVANAMSDPETAWCRWAERSSRDGSGKLSRAPVDVAPVLRTILFDPMKSVVLTSATLTAAGRFDHMLSRVGLPVETITARFDSPFSYRDQAILGLPKDLPHPDHADFVETCGAMMVSCLRASGGGAFVLCTSFQHVRAFTERFRQELGEEMPILSQGKGGRERLLARFQQNHASVLVGTDSFWEGISVRGDNLRLVLIPKLPFRVPTDPIAEARWELMQQRGQDPFRGYALPQAILRLRQGFGRLIRSRTDRGAVVLLDRRLHEMWYGRMFLSSLPDARRVVGPGRAVVESLRQLFAERAIVGAEADHER